MRVNARFEGEAEQQLNFLAEATGLGVSEVLRTSVQRYYEQVRAQRSGLAHFSAFIGRGRSGRSDIAGSYKARLAEGWVAKHQGRGHGQALAVHEPAPPPWPASQSAQPPQSMQAATPPSAPAVPTEPAKSAAGADADAEANAAKGRK
jgi:hypothetical protein